MILSSSVTYFLDEVGFFMQEHLLPQYFEREMSDGLLYIYKSAREEPEEKPAAVYGPTDYRQHRLVWVRCRWLPQR